MKIQSVGTNPSLDFGELLKSGKIFPCGIQNFREMRTDGYIYVDKTKQLVQLINTGKSYFLSRPRRFGKSLTISTLEALLSGRKEYFSGLYAEPWLNRKDYRPTSVILLDMSMSTVNNDLSDIDNAIVRSVKESAKDFDIEISEQNPVDAFLELIDTLYYPKRIPIALLIDEYDSLPLRYIDKPEIAHNVRLVLQDFYRQIKANDKKFNFIFVTGISRFSMTSMFSALNSLTDISLDSDYATICGYTQNELEENFATAIKYNSLIKGVSISDYIHQMKSYYDGFSFDGDTRVYNPYSLLMCLKKNKFVNYWFGTATPTYLENYIVTKKIKIEDYVGYPIHENQIINASEIEITSPALLLYQGGYLTLEKRIREYTYILNYPNEEVYQSVGELLARSIYGETRDTKDMQTDIYSALIKKDMQGLMGIINCIIESPGYDTFYELSKVKNVKHESFFRDMIAIFMFGTNEIDVSREVFGSRGRSDIVAKVGGRTYLLELKVSYPGDNPVKLLEEARVQINTRKYFIQHFFTSNIVTTSAVVIDDEQRKIVKYDVVDMKKETILACENNEAQ
ncbi:MAG: ATP-binding protein [Desulfovibrio sp.]|jgi:hypothetical protein|nr:ATP-binding protein [Desulfovibrio sp.]